jgi:hypothetical protein
MKFRIQTITKSTEFPFLSGIQLSDPLLMEIDFSLQEGAARSLSAKFHQKSKVPRFSSELSSEFQHIEVL